MFTQTISEITRVEIDRVEQFVAERDDAQAIPRDTAEFLHLLTLLGGFRRGLEVGTSYGYSTLWIGAALAHNGGTLTTLEKERAKIDAARESFQRAELGDVISIVAGDGAQSLQELHGPYDFVFLDAGQSAAERYFELIWPKLGHHATIVTDNVSTHEKQLQGLVRRLREERGLASSRIQIGTGLEVSVRVEPYGRAATVDGADWVI